MVKLALLRKSAIGMWLLGLWALTSACAHASEYEVTAVFRVLGWDQTWYDVGYEATPGNPGKLTVPNGSISSEFSYAGPRDLTFLRPQSPEHDHAATAEALASIRLPAGKGQRFLLLFQGTGDAVGIIRVDEGIGGFVEHGLRFINGSDTPLRIYVGGQSVLAEARGAAQLIATDSENTTIRITALTQRGDDEGGVEELIYSSRWRPRHHMQLITFIMPVADGDEQRLQVRRFREGAP